MTETAKRFLEWLSERCEAAAEKLEREQCPHFMVFGGDNYIGKVFCQKNKGHWGCHRTAEGKEF